jgi:purine-binding chemotaxis protein CheW
MQANNDTTGIPTDTTAEPLEFLTFRLGNEEYGIDIQKVNELRGYDKVTRIANTPDFIKGVVNLRGSVVQIVDMRIRFNLGVPVYNEFTVVIILNVSGRVIGMVVDSVSDVITLTRDQVKPPPIIETALDADFMMGIGAVDQRMLILLDIEKLMFSAEASVTREIETVEA